ncbi:MAG TPA: hypothetical protein VLT62_29685 [Candidatus Methylomirabilis sp.]|nr:hypothetical protein [Candidatus Methylomirabilis sp.]
MEKGKKKAPAEPHPQDNAGAGGAEAKKRRTGEPTARRPAAEQLGAILTKSLDLAEASLSLGLTMISRVGAMAQREVIDRMAAAGGAAGAGAGAPGDATATPGPEHVHGSAGMGGTAPEGHGARGEVDPATMSPGQAYVITNRLPLSPGAPVSISFSINNDDMTTAKTVALAVEGFAGELESGRLDAAGFSVKPARKTIAAMDFEKFVLEGALPPETPPDVYHGWVVVTSGAEFRIPVRLVVLPL